MKYIIYLHCKTKIMDKHCTASKYKQTGTTKRKKNKKRPSKTEKDPKLAFSTYKRRVFLFSTWQPVPLSNSHFPPSPKPPKTKTTNKKQHSHNHKHTHRVIPRETVSLLLFPIQISSDVTDSSLK